MAQRLHEKPGIGFDRPGRGEVQFVSKYLRCLIARRRRGNQLGNHWIVEGGYRVIFFDRSEEHTSELQSLMRISYAVFCLTKKKLNYIKYINHKPTTTNTQSQI